MSSFTEKVLVQFSDFVRAARNWKPPKNDGEQKLSRGLGGALLILILVGLTLLFRLDFVPFRTQVRAFLIVLPLLIMSYILIRGLSISWLIQGIKDFWIPSTLILSSFLMLVIMLLTMVMQMESNNYIAIFGGFFLCFLSIVLISIYRALAERLRNADPERTQLSQLKFGDQLRYIFSYLFVGLWFTLFLGGLMMIIWGTGLGRMILSGLAQ